MNRKKKWYKGLQNTGRWWLTGCLILIESYILSAQTFADASHLASDRFPAYTFEPLQQFKTDVASYFRLRPILAGSPVDRQLVVVLASNGTTLVLGKLPEEHLLTQADDLPEGAVWTCNGDQWQPVIIEQTEDHRGHNRQDIMLSVDGDTLSTREWRSYFGDSVVTAYVFLPDPLTVAEADYGGDLVDDNDADNPVLNSLRSIVTLTATFESDTFFLFDTYIHLSDFALPAQEVAWSLLPSFDAGRGDPAFEDVNTLYHLQQCRQWLEERGYGPLAEFEIDIDTHGAGGADNSFFSASGTPSIQFGEGGVDDAEDADVIIHEYTHALSHSAAPFSNIGLERRALDEGYADYLAASYSLRWSDFRWQEVFSWDGHNEFWDGRSLDNEKHYPEDNSANIYTSSGIWSGALADVLESIGQEATDQLVLEALYGSYDEMTMPEAAVWLLEAEDLLFGGIYHDAVYDILEQRGLIESTELSYDHDSVCSVFNTAAFASGTGPLLFHTSDGLHNIRITDASGRIVRDLQAVGPDFQWQPELTPGMYIIMVAGTCSLSNKILVW